MTKMNTKGPGRTRPAALRAGAAAWLVAFFLLCVWGARLAAQDRAPDGIQAGSHCLWRVQSETTSVYLVGSVHLLRADNYPLSPAIEKAFRDSQRLVLELKLDDVSSQDQGTILAKGRLDPGTTLEGIVSPKTYGLLRERVKQVGIPVQALAPFKPWVASLMLTTLKLKQLGYDPQYGVDQ